MREDIKKKKYKMLHRKINDMYCNEFKNVKQCCKEAGISTGVYYKICKDLGKKSVGAPRKTTKPRGSKTKRSKSQRGGNVIDINDNVFETNLNTNQTKNDESGHLETRYQPNYISPPHTEEGPETKKKRHLRNTKTQQIT